jgi:tetratricopeptide (TPR) repeat protein
MDPEDRSGAVAKILMHRARYLVRVKRDYPAAVTYLRAAVKQKPKNDWGWYLVAALSHRLSKPAAARHAIDRAIALEPGSAFYVHEKRRMGASRRR